MVRARDLIGRLIPVDRRVAFPEHGQRALIGRPRRSGQPAERFDLVEIIRVGLRCQATRRRRRKLRAVLEHECLREGEALCAHGAKRRWRRPPLADRQAACERRTADAESVGGAQGQHGVGDLLTPLDPACARLSAIVTFIPERCE